MARTSTILAPFFQNILPLSGPFCCARRDFLLTIARIRRARKGYTAVQRHDSRAACTPSIAPVLVIWGEAGYNGGQTRPVVVHISEKVSGAFFRDRHLRPLAERARLCRGHVPVSNRPCEIQPKSHFTPDISKGPRHIEALALNEIVRSGATL
jgi:hypothetical protein